MAENDTTLWCDTSRTGSSYTLRSKGRRTDARENDAGSFSGRNCLDGDSR